MNWTTWFWTCHLELVISTSLCHRFARVLDKGRVTLVRVFAEAVLDLNGRKMSKRVSKKKKSEQFEGENYACTFFKIKIECAQLMFFRSFRSKL